MVWTTCQNGFNSRKPRARLKSEVLLTEVGFPTRVFGGLFVHRATVLVGTRYKIAKLYLIREQLGDQGVMEHTTFVFHFACLSNLFKRVHGVFTWKMSKEIEGKLVNRRLFSLFKSLLFLGCSRGEVLSACCLCPAARVPLQLAAGLWHCSFTLHG